MKASGIVDVAISLVILSLLLVIAVGFVASTIVMSVVLTVDRHTRAALARLKGLGT